MFNYKRIEDIFNYIRSNDYTTAAKLADLFKVSSVQFVPISII